MRDLATYIIDRFSDLAEKRRPWADTWDELADYYLPMSFTGDNGVLPGQAGDEHIYESTPTHALELLAASLGGLLTNPAVPWFGIKVVENTSDLGELADDQDVKEYLSDVRDRMLIMFNENAANFQSHVHELYQTHALFGTSCMYVEDDPDTVVRFSSRTIKEIYITEDYRGRVDTVFRKAMLTARHLVQEFGRDKVSAKVSEAYEKKPDTEFEVVHAVYPRVDRDPGSKLSKDMPIASVFVEKESKHVLLESGFHEMPYMVPRWSKASGEVYGRGPGLTALAQVRVLNAQAETKMIAEEKAADNPLMLPDDGFMGPINTGAGGISYYRSGTGDMIKQLPISTDFASLENSMQQRREDVRMIFQNDQLQLVGGPDMTATEARIRQEEKYRLLGPMLGRLQTEFLAPLIERVYGIMSRAGALPDIPDVLQDIEWTVSYESPVARAQRSYEAQSMQQTVEFIAPLIGEGDPFGVLDNFDPDRITRDAAEMFGMKPDWLRSEEEVQKARADRAQAMNDQANMQNMQQSADMAQKLGNTPLEGGQTTALDKLAELSGEAMPATEQELE